MSAMSERGAEIDALIASMSADAVKALAERLAGELGHVLRPATAGAGLIVCGPDLKVHPIYIASLAWERRSYANGPGDSVLVITMHDGQQHRLTHNARPGTWGGIDAYAVETAICAALSDQGRGG